MSSGRNEWRRLQAGIRRTTRDVRQRRQALHKLFQQRLETDPGSCGKCFNECLRIASPGDYPGKVMKVSRDGGNATTLALVESDGSSAIALDDKNVYWAEGDGAYGPLYSVSTSGGAIHRLSCQ